MMKILHISTNDIQGGAALGTYMLHKALQKQGFDSQMLVRRKYSDDPSVHQSKETFQIFGKTLSPRILINRIIARLFPNPIGNDEIYSREIWAPSPITREINAINPDIVNIHWTQHAFFIPQDLAKINVPIVWTMRDMWVLTGGEHYTQDFENLYTATQRPSPSKTLQRKKYYFDQADIHFCGISDWITDLARRAYTTAQSPADKILNGVDTGIFKPKRISADIYQKFNLPQDKKIICFGALNADTDSRKGTHYVRELVESMQSHPESREIHYCIFGNRDPDSVVMAADNFTALGHLDYEQLSLLYTLSDITIIPSELEAFGKTAAESICCGTPVLCFDTSGLKEIIDHKKTGYRAKCYDVEDLKNGLIWLLNNKPTIDTDAAIAKFSIDRMAQDYIDYYQSILSRPHQ